MLENAQGDMDFMIVLVIDRRSGARACEAVTSPGRHLEHPATFVRVAAQQARA